MKFGDLNIELAIGRKIRLTLNGKVREGKLFRSTKGGLYLAVPSVLPFFKEDALSLAGVALSTEITILDSERQ